MPGAGARSTPTQCSAVGLQDSEKRLEALELRRILLIPGSRFTSALPFRLRTAALGAQSPRTDSGDRCDRGPSYCCKPVWLPCRACGMEQGVERKGEEPGRPAGGACSLPESRPPRSLLAASFARTPARRAGTRGRRVLPLLGLHPRSRLALPPAAAGSWWSACYSAGERSGGKEGERGDTHTGRGARALHTRSRASPSPRVRAECGPAAGPGTCRLRRCPGSAPPAARRSHQGTRDIPTTCPPWRNWSWPPKLQHAGRGR